MVGCLRVSRFVRLAVCALSDLGGWRFWAVGGFGCWRCERLAVGGVGGLRGWLVGGWRFGRLAVWAVGGLRGWRVARLAVYVVGR